MVILSGGRPVRQLGPRASGLTNANGVAVVRVRGLPRRFTVVVRGGRAAGRRLGGNLRSLSESRHRMAAVVEVNPLTTLLVEVRGQRPRLSAARASREIKRYFGVPWWSNLGENLREGPHWFSVQAYLRDVRRYGSIDRLNRALTRQILRGNSSAQPYGSATTRARLRSAATTARVAIKGQPDLTPDQRVAEVFKTLREAKLKNGVIKLVVGGVLGGLLEAAQANGVLPKDDLQVVREQLTGIGTQLTALQGQMTRLDVRFANSDFSRLFGQGIKVTSDIDTARGDLAEVAALDPEAANREKLSKETLDFIRAHLRGAPIYFDQFLNPKFDTASNPIKAMSAALGTSSRFFDARQSGQVRAVYDYYATYQAQLAVLLTNYWNASGAYTPDGIETKLEEIQTSVARTERESLKPTVPAGTFIDTTTPTFMWGTDNRAVNALTLVEQNLETSRTLALGGFRNYQMPSFPDLSKLVAGVTGPRAWLQAQVNVNLAHQLVWASGAVRIENGFAFNGIGVRIFDLATGKEEQHGYGNSSWFVRVLCRRGDLSKCVSEHRQVQDFLRTKSGGMLLLRYLAPGESYWW